jgi:hypothetical protein
VHSRGHTIAQSATPVDASPARVPPRPIRDVNSVHLATEVGAGHVFASPEGPR